MTLAQASIELESMKAANAQRGIDGKSPAYGEEQIVALIEKHDVHHNSVLTAFYNGL